MELPLEWPPVQRVGVVPGSVSVSVLLEWWLRGLVLVLVRVLAYRPPWAWVLVAAEPGLGVFRRQAPNLPASDRVAAEPELGVFRRPSHP